MGNDVQTPFTPGELLEESREVRRPGMKNNLEMFNNIACSESCKVSGIFGGYGACGKRIDPSSSSCFMLYPEGSDESRKGFTQRNSVMGANYEKRLTFGQV